MTPEQQQNKIVHAEHMASRWLNRWRNAARDGRDEWAEYCFNQSNRWLTTAIKIRDKTP